MPVNPLLIQGAATAGKTLFDFFGANSAAKKRQKQIDDEIKRKQGTLGTKFIDVNRIQGAADRARIEEAQGVGRHEKALNADVGSFVGGALEKSLPERARTRANLILKDELGRTARDTQTEDDISRLKLLDAGQPSTGGLIGSLLGTAGSTYAGIEAGKQAEAKALQTQTDKENLIPRVPTAQDPNYSSGYDRIGGAGVSSPNIETLQQNQIPFAPSFQTAPQQSQGQDIRALTDQTLSGQTPQLSVKDQLDDLKLKTAQFKFNQLVSGDGGKTEITPPTPTQTTGLLDKFIKERQGNILAQGGEGYSYQDLQQDAERGLNKASGFLGFGEKTPDRTKQNQLEQYDYYSDPANRMTLADDSLGVRFPERYNQSQQTGDLVQNQQAVQVLTNPKSEFYVSDWATISPVKQQILIDLITKKLLETK